jgi:hypothetical protein
MNINLSDTKTQFVIIVIILLIIGGLYYYKSKTLTGSPTSTKTSPTPTKTSPTPTNTSPTPKPTNASVYGKWLSDDGYTLIINNDNTLLNTKPGFSDQYGKYNPVTGQICRNDITNNDCKVDDDASDRSISYTTFKISDINNAIERRDSVFNSYVLNYKRIN